MTLPSWDDRYRLGEAADRPPEPLLAQLDALPPGRALDLACGPGRNTIYLAGRGWHVTAIDSSQVALDLLRRRAAALSLDNIDIQRHDFEAAPPAFAACDLILDCYYLHRPLFPAIRDAIVPGGIFFAVIPLLDPAHPMNPLYVLQPGELRLLFADWELLHDREGPSTHRSRAVAELIARKPTHARA